MSIPCGSVFAASSCSPSTAAGGQAEALEVYHEFRTALQEELGLEPSPLLRELEAAILRQDPVLSRRSTTSGVALARKPVTVLCVALQMETGSGTALDPEAHEVVSEYSVSGLAAVLERYGGKLAISAGERLMGVFGVAQLARGRCSSGGAGEPGGARRAQRRSGHSAAPYGASLTCRFGLATGEALVGGSGPLGFAGDVDTRAVMLAAGRRTWSDPHQPADATARCGSHRDRKCRSDRFIVRSAHAGVRPLALRFDAPLVGRDEEMRRLQPPTLGPLVSG